MIAEGSIAQARVAIVADDLTGACDAAVAFARRGMPTVVRLDGYLNGEGAQVVAVSTESRDIAEEDVAERLQVVARQLEAHRSRHGWHVFKKIDSVFRGNTFAEIEVAARIFPGGVVMVAPAYPALGRTSKDGRLWIRDVTGSASIAVLDGLVARGLRVGLIAAGADEGALAEEMQRAVTGGCRVLCCDAASEEDVERIVVAGDRLGENLQCDVLWVGSAGLAHALAARLLLGSNEPGSAEAVEPTEGTVIFFVGSDHPVTLQQVDALCAEKELSRTENGSRISACEDRTLMVVRVDRGRTTEEEIRAAMQGLETKDVSCMFMTGGDTAALVCRALGVESIRLCDEFEPGLPRGIAGGGAMEGKTVILKSGGFGTTDVLCRIAKRFTTRKEAVH